MSKNQFATHGLFGGLFVSFTSENLLFPTQLFTQLEADPECNELC